MRSLRAPLLAAAVSIGAMPGPAVVSAQHPGFAPGPGWTGSGPAALLGSGLPSYVGGVPDAAGLWGAWSRPWGVAGLEQGEFGATLAVRPGLLLSAGWRQVSGDGLVQRYGELGLSQAPHLAAALGIHHLGGTGQPGRASLSLRLSASAESPWGLLAAATTRLEARPGVARHLRLQWSAGWRVGPFFLRAGGSRPERESAIVIAWERTGWGGGVGWWGVRPSPSAFAWVEQGGIRWRLDARWVPGAGLHLVWSICSRGAAP